jgi:hypothetical protein
LLVAGVALVVAGFGLPVVQPFARLVLIVLAVLMVAWVVLANPGKIVGAIIGWLFLTDARADWRTIRRVLLIFGVVVGVAVAPPVAGHVLLAAGLGLLSGVAARPGVQALAPRVRAPVLEVDLGDRWAAYRFKRSYQQRAAELGWDVNRRGAKDRMAVPALVECRRMEGDWTCVFVSRGDWTPDEWEKQAHALKRSLDGRTVRVSHQGRRVVVQVWTRPLPAPGDLRVTEPPRITADGILVGHDPARREVRWAANDTSAHGLFVGAPGAGKSHLAGLMLLQAAVTPGWEGVMLDAKETRDWEWLAGYGVRVIRSRTEIHEYLAWLEGERQRVESTGRVEVTRLVMLDEARLILGTHKGKDKAARDESVAVAGDLTGLGRSAGIRFVPIIQRPDVEHIGGGYLRDNLTLRVALGRLEGDGITMAFEGRQVSGEERRLLDGTPGRALVSGLRGGDMDAWLVQVPELAVQRVGGGASTGPVAAPEPDTDGGDGSPRQVMRGQVVQGLVDLGPVVLRSRLAYHLGVDATNTTFRRACADLAAEGVVREGRGPRNGVTLTLVTENTGRVPHAGQQVFPVDAATA